MNQPSSQPRTRRTLFISLMTLLVCAVITITAWSASSSSALAFMPNPEVPASPTHGHSYGMVELIKPTYTATVLPSPTAITIVDESSLDNALSSEETLSTDKVSLPIDTSLVALAEIVEDTPVPQYASPANQESDQQIPAYGGNKYILVDISEQHMYVYEGEVLVFSFVSSTGMYNATRVGTFSVLDKIPSAYGATWDIWMPNWLGIYWAGSLENGIHALPILPNGAQLWAGYLGTPISYGCVVLGAYESQLLYDWAEVGTPVEIRW